MEFSPALRSYRYTASVYYQNNIRGFDVPGAGGNVSDLLTGAGAATSHSGPLEHQNRSFRSEPGEGEHQSLSAPVSRSEPEATAHSGSGAEPQDLGGSMVVGREPRSEVAGSYPDCVAISHTTSAVTSVVASSEYQVVAGNGRWELGLQVAFLDPAPEPEPEPEPEERSSSNEGVQLELPCPVIAVRGECEKGHFWAKECICNREWCMELEGRCGGDGGAAHQRRKARWLLKAYKMGDMGRFVLTLPPEIRDRYRTQRTLGELGTAAKRMMQRYGYKRGLRRWHLFGEDHPGHGLQGQGLPPYHPHLELLVDGKWLKKKQMRAIKQSWANILGVSVKRINIYYSYTPANDINKKLHRISYALRPTFTDWRWDEPLAYELIGFHNAQTWGSRDDWESDSDLWKIPEGEGTGPELEALEEGRCPIDKTPITWGGLMSPKFLVEPWEPVGAGYWRYTVDSMLSEELQARDGPGRGDG